MLVPVLIAFALSMTPAAQATGTVSGTVVDTSSQVVPGGTVTLTNEATRDARTTVGGAQGGFAFQDVAPGSYSVKIGLTGFHTREQTKNVVNASGTVDLGQVSWRSARLKSSSVVAEGRPSKQEQRLLWAPDRDQISQIQSRGRDVVNLLRLLPGVHHEANIEPWATASARDPEHQRRCASIWNQVTVDGLNGNELSGTNRM